MDVNLQFQSDGRLPTQGHHLVSMEDCTGTGGHPGPTLRGCRAGERHGVWPRPRSTGVPGSSTQSLCRRVSPFMTNGPPVRRRQLTDTGLFPSLLSHVNTTCPM